jgi:hypothetical protein
MSESREFDLVIRGPEDVVSFLRACGVPTDEPAQILLGLTRAEAAPTAHAICGAAVRSGPDAARPVDAGQLVDLADELLVGSVVLATVEARAGRAPGRPELGRVVSLRRDCADDGIVLLDWIVVTGHLWWSMREQVIHEAA